MASLPIDLFLFDLAGTTVRDDGLVLGTFRSVTEEADLQVEDDWLQARMGYGKERVFHDLLESRELPVSNAGLLARRFETVLAETLVGHTAEPLPGAIESIEALERAGIKVGFTTGFSRPTANLLLEQIGWHRKLSVTSDEVPSGRPAPDMIRRAMSLSGVDDPGRVGVAGDTPADLLAGVAADCRFVVGVGHGTHSLRDLEDHPHTHLLPDLTRLMVALAE
jgi:phosphonatase-like hydrolase